MTYPLSDRLFVENGPAISAHRALARSSSEAYRAWRSLNAEDRIGLVETALRNPANDQSPDHFPVAL